MIKAETEQFVVLKLLGDYFVIVLSSDLNVLLPKIAAVLPSRKKPMTVVFDLLLRNSISDRFYAYEFIGNDFVSDEPRRVRLSFEQFEKLMEFYKERADLLDFDCGNLHSVQKKLIRRGAIELLYINYCYYEDSRQV